MAHTIFLESQAVWKILAAGLVFGAGLPALFAVGIRSLAYGTGGDAQAHPAGTEPVAHPMGRVVAAVCLAVVVLAVALGILDIVVTGMGKALSFDHVYPVITEKK